MRLLGLWLLLDLGIFLRFSDLKFSLFCLSTSMSSYSDSSLEAEQETDLTESSDAEAESDWSLESSES